MKEPRQRARLGHVVPPNPETDDTPVSHYRVLGSFVGRVETLFLTTRDLARLSERGRSNSEDALVLHEYVDPIDLTKISAPPTPNTDFPEDEGELVDEVPPPSRWSRFLSWLSGA